MFRVPHTQALCGLLAAALISVHLPAQAAGGELIGRVNSSVLTPSVLPNVGGDPNAGGMTTPVIAKALAVADFSNDTGDARYDNLKRGISESLVTKLARRPELKLVERSQIDKAIKELGFGQTAFADSSKTAQIGKMTGAGVMVTGSLVKAGSKMEINVRMLDVETGQVVVSESYLFQSEDDILPVVNYLSLLIPKKLNLYVSDAEMELARGQLKGVTIKGEDNTWIYWTIGGAVVVVGAIVAGVVLVARANAKANEGPDIVITNPRDGSGIQLRSQAPLQFNLPAMKF
ncbi:hypothetical protein COW36_16550 [bacterium (Candidatus Blackallbacteria) CG17_big_fil_post_rev_8_21_14_2_50_48_46]|uniref:FlgO domain-containing protein n=1 Tax=bacterium (Candidatus Blackallbacteria) CG17_big_fil_post_rev_8_21_14_2_50_48_46 TaxID=2014261 RepID=A0A2M7G2F0_9BACT|nr:MAG: hypothetical protein COW64_08085 [bacterium (Candidatus Blackallbacteria) CG18_big_fil_WC_8_21_14_2_50_49_26]PIW15558.1 MAG: hypothetical protein COW36_16550 [bacterium (Candidatus Blackallbacteria) CG17_big_fil_post_rev_8_21_14_2_50_48_46]PIW49349.1 MAG: hypothetical protein COW20_05980 [bacterium (Candidatus Blackallbacteria) CG13_big_fil_rev_8_21_14_2_50_49_14]